MGLLGSASKKDKAAAAAAAPSSPTSAPAPPAEETHTDTTTTEVPLSPSKDKMHVRFEEAPPTPTSTNELMADGTSPSPKKNRPPLSTQTSLGARIMSSLSRTLSALTPRNKDEEDWEDMDVPDNFMAACGGKKKKAVAMYRQMLRWRKENEIDTMLERPYTHWEPIKKYYPHAMHCRGRQEEFVSIEMPAKMDLGMLKKTGCTPTVMGLHLAFVFEYAFTNIDSRDTTQTITIMDCNSLSLTQAASLDNLSLIKAVCEINSRYYPGRAHKILAVNPPRFFGPVFNLIKNVLPNGLSTVVECVSLQELHKYVDPANLPAQLGGTSKIAVGESELEKGLTAFVAKLNSQSTAF